MKRFTIVPAVLLLVACGGGEPAPDAASEPAAAAAAPEAAAPAGEMSMRDWFRVDEANQSVHMTITAGSVSDAIGYWNFNGGTNGDMTITVPEGFTVVIDFKNDDPNMAHSLGISATTSGFGAMIQPDVAFEGALTSNPTSMVDATMPGQEESITFVASAAGDYAMVCYIPGHAATGMWIYFNVSADGSYGVLGGN